MSFTNTTVNKTTADNTYTQAVNISGKGSGQSVSYSSSDESIATVNNSGVVTLKSKVGTTTITASVEASGTYCSASASYTLNVTPAPINVTLHYKGTSTLLSNQTNPYTLPTTGAYVANACDAWVFDGWYNNTYAKNTSKPTYITQLTSTGDAYAVYKHTETSGGGGSSDVDFVFEDIASSESWGEETDGHNDITISPVNISVSKGSASYCGRWWSDNTWRIYSGNKITITTTSGEITAVSSTPSRTFTIADGKATLTASSRIDFTSITVTYSNSSTTYYSTDAECGPKVQATASPWVTSTNGQFIKVEVPVTATNFDKNSTLSASVSGAGFSIVGWGANGNVVTKDVDLTTSLILEYNPTAYNTTADATITFSSNYSGSQTPVYTAGTVHGRSLPEKFVIAIKNGDQWYALPANMSGSGTYAGE
ncbi:MAG: hypothetical protein IKQ50_00490, partial [Paludibacteraceae bacterium]|nr:hypothetical protein [Paludibacteraceae bacterium]